MKHFGLALVKEMGSSVGSKSVSREDETFYFERAFTRVEYAKLAAILAASDDPLMKDLYKDFSERAINGYGSM